MVIKLLLRRQKPSLSFARNYAKRASLKAVQSESLWETVIGLEIHSQISAKSKLFSGSGTSFASPVNTLVSFFDASLPGTLPVLNRRCVEAGVLTALALQCQLNLISTFDRKHYFYADLPAGFQITQQRRPLAKGGHVDYLVTEDDRRKPTLKTARLIQLQLEHDSGKSLHDVEMSYSLIDLNRAGVGLMEIVTEPDFRSATEAASFVRELQLILQTIGVCDGKMEEGSLRVDASISVRRTSDEPLGVRAEIKNLNSIRSLIKSIEFEAQRQVCIREAGEEVLNETRAYDVETGETVSMRDKERLHDYRFMAEPNLPPLRLYTNDSRPVGISSDQVINVDDLRLTLPELPNAKRLRLQEQHGLSVTHSNILVKEPLLLDCYEKCIGQGQRNVKIATNFFINEVLAAVNKKNIEFSNSHLTSEFIGELVDMITDETISLQTAKMVLEILLDDPSKSPKQVVEERCWHQVSDETSLAMVCRQVLEENPKVVSEYKSGKTKVFNFLVGEVQKKLGSRSNAKIVVRLLQENLR